MSLLTKIHAFSVQVKSHKFRKATMCTATKSLQCLIHVCHSVWIIFIQCMLYMYEACSNQHLLTYKQSSLQQCYLASFKSLLMLRLSSILPCQLLTEHAMLSSFKISWKPNLAQKIFKRLGEDVYIKTQVSTTCRFYVHTGYMWAYTQFRWNHYLICTTVSEPQLSDLSCLIHNIKMRKSYHHYCSYLCYYQCCHNQRCNSNAFVSLGNAWPM